MAYFNLFIYNASWVPELYKLYSLAPFIMPKAFTRGQQPQHTPSKRHVPATFKTSQATISTTRAVQWQEKEKRSLGESSANRPAPAHKLKLSFCRLGTGKGTPAKPANVKDVHVLISL